MTEQYEHSCFCQGCHTFFAPDAADMTRWRQGFSPVRCSNCKQKELEKKRADSAQGDMNAGTN